PADHQRSEALGTGVVAGVSGSAGDREAIRTAQDGLRGGACVPEGSESDPGSALPVFLGAAGAGVVGAGAAASDGAAAGGELAVVSGRSSVPLPDHTAVDRAV